MLTLQGLLGVPTFLPGKIPAKQMIFGAAGVK